MTLLCVALTLAICCLATWLAEAKRTIKKSNDTIAELKHELQETQVGKTVDLPEPRRDISRLHYPLGYGVEP